MTRDDRLNRGLLQRALNKARCTATDRFQAYAILDRDGIHAALAFCAALPQRVTP